MLIQHGNGTNSRINKANLGCSLTPSSFFFACFSVPILNYCLPLPDLIFTFLRKLPIRWTWLKEMLIKNIQSNRESLPDELGWKKCWSRIFSPTVNLSTRWTWLKEMLIKNISLFSPLTTCPNTPLFLFWHGLKKYTCHVLQPHRHSIPWKVYW